MTLTYRLVKGVPLTHAEMDANISTLSESINAMPYIGTVISNTWYRAASICRLRLTGTGTITIDARNALGVVTTGVASYTVSGATNQIHYTCCPDDTVEIRQVPTGTATAELLPGGEKRKNLATRRAILIGDSITAQNNLTNSVNITSVNGVATVTHTAHQVVLGQPFRIGKSTVTEQNGYWTVASITDANTYTYNHGTGSGSMTGAEMLNPLRNVADGAFTWFNSLCANQYDVVRNYGQSSAKTDTVLQILGSQWVDDQADEAFVMLGINDVTNDIAVATITAQLEQIYDFVLSKGMELNIITTLPMYTSHALFTAERMKVVHSLVGYQKAYARSHKNVRIMDAHGVIVDPTSTTGSARQYALRDHLHPGENGAYVIGKKMVADRYGGATLIPAGRWPMGALDGYDNNTAAWNKLPNPMMLGTGGTLAGTGGGAVGTVATGITATHNVASGSSFTCSIVARADGVGNDQRGVFVATAAAQSATFSYASIHTQLVAGERYKIGANIKMSNVTNLDYAFFEVSMWGVGSLYSNVRALSQGASSTDPYNKYPEVNTDLWVESEEFTLPAGVTSAIVTCKLMSSGVGGCTLDMGKTKFERVG